jgi:hypothetical protein
MLGLKKLLDGHFSALQPTPPPTAAMLRLGRSLYFLFNTVRFILLAIANHFSFVKNFLDRVIILDHSCIRLNLLQLEVNFY